MKNKSITREQFDKYIITLEVLENIMDQLQLACDDFLEKNPEVWNEEAKE